jgi:hypothetical protein
MRSTGWFPGLAPHRNRGCAPSARRRSPAAHLGQRAIRPTSAYARPRRCAKAWAQYFAVVRAASHAWATGGYEELGVVPIGGALFPCPSPITAPIQPASPGEYSPRLEYVIPLDLRGGTNPDNGQLTRLQAAVSDLELGLRREGFGRFSLDSHDPGYYFAWRGSGRVEVAIFNDFANYPPTGVYVLIVSRCARFDPAALPDLLTWLRKSGPPPAAADQLRGGLLAGRRGHRARTR